MGDPVFRSLYLNSFDLLSPRGEDDGKTIDHHKPKGKTSLWWRSGNQKLNRWGGGLEEWPFGSRRLKDEFLCLGNCIF